MTKTTSRKIDPFLPARLLIPSAETMAEQHGITVEEAKTAIRELERQDVFMNKTYQVNVGRVQTPFGPMLHLSIKRRDKQPIHDWRELQQIKTQIVGPECEAVELYPAESLVVDTANQYHLWALPSPGIRFPFGFEEGLVSGESVGGAIQRPFSET